MNSKMIFAFLFCFLIAASKPSFAFIDPVREQQFNDAIKDAVKVIRYKKSQHDTRLAPTLYDFADSRFLDALWDQNHLIFAQVDWTHDALTLETPQGTRVVDAINTPSRGLIQIRTGAWDEIYLNVPRRIAFAMHELLSVRSYDERDYQLTAPLLEILETEYRPDVMLATFSQKTLNWLNADLRAIRNRNALLSTVLTQIKESEQGRACVSGRRREENCLFSMSYAVAALTIHQDHEGRTEEEMQDRLREAQLSLSFIQLGISNGDYSVRRWRRQALIQQIDGILVRLREQYEQVGEENSAVDVAYDDMYAYRNSLPGSLPEQAAALWIEERDRAGAVPTVIPQNGMILVMDRCRGTEGLAISCILENLEMMEAASSERMQFLSRLSQDSSQAYFARLEQLFRNTR